MEISGSGTSDPLMPVLAVDMVVFVSGSREAGAGNVAVFEILSSAFAGMGFLDGAFVVGAETGGVSCWGLEAALEAR